MKESKPMDRKIVESLIKEEEEFEEQPQEEKTNVSAIISDLVRREWESIDLINSYLVVSQEYDLPELQSVLNSFLDDHYIHIGQLEGVLEGKVPEAEQIDDAKDEAGEEEIEVEEEPVEEVPEEEDEIDDADVFFPDDDIPVDVADEIDFSDKKEED